MLELNLMYANILPSRFIHQGLQIDLFPYTNLIVACGNSSSNAHVKPPSFHHVFLVSRSRVLNLRDNQVTRSNIRQLVHRNRNILPKHHSLHSNPSITLERIDRRRTTSRCDLARSIEQGALDVVRAKHVLLRSWEKISGCV